MEFRIADTFTDSLSRLTVEEQKAVKTTAFDLQVNPSNPGMQFHKLDRAKDKHFWSVRVSGDLRIIVHRTAGNLLLCYVGHHDEAYRWAERRKLEIHPKTGAAQLVEIRERVEEVFVHRYVQAEPPPQAKPPLFAGISEGALLAYGVPEEWLGDVRGRSRMLRINYRTSHQIRMQADRLLGPELSDVDGNTEERRGTISVFNGPQPTILALDNPKDEIEAVSQWLTERETICL